MLIQFISYIHLVIKSCAIHYRQHLTVYPYSLLNPVYSQSMYMCMIHRELAFLSPWLVYLYHYPGTAKYFEYILINHFYFWYSWVSSINFLSHHKIDPIVDYTRPYQMVKICIILKMMFLAQIIRKFQICNFQTPSNLKSWRSPNPKNYRDISHPY